MNKKFELKLNGSSNRAPVEKHITCFYSDSGSQVTFKIDGLVVLEVTDSGYCVFWGGNVREAGFKVNLQKEPYLP